MTKLAIYVPPKRNSVAGQKEIRIGFCIMAEDIT
jgi:hypothetical protein